MRNLIGTAVLLLASFFLQGDPECLAQTSSAVNILFLSDASGSSRTIGFPTDATISSLSVDLSTQEANSFVLTLRRPDTTVVLGTDPGVTVRTSPTKTILVIATPVVGNWSVELSGAGAYSLVVSGISNLDVSLFEFVRIGGRPGHEAFFSLPGDPIASRINFVHSTIKGTALTTQFDFRTPTGSLIQSFTLTRDAINGISEFIGTVVPPSGSFIPYATGTNALGQAFQRVIPKSFIAQTVLVEPPPPQDLVPGTTATFLFKVTNLGGNDTFLFAGSDEKGFSPSVIPLQQTLTTNQSTDISLTIQVPASAQIGSSDKLNLTAQGGTGTSNSASVRSGVFALATVVVPSIVGLSQGSATSALTDLGLALGKTTDAASTSIARGNVISQIPQGGTTVPIGSPVALTVSSGSGVVVTGDLDGDGDVDKNDINMVLAAKGTAASGPSDPRDIDKDGQITILDARKLTTMCTRPNCAP